MLLKNRVMKTFLLNGLLIYQISPMYRAYQLAPKKKELTTLQVATKQSAFNKLKEKRMIEAEELKNIHEKALQIKQNAQIKHLKEIVKSGEVLIYQEGTALYDTIPLEKAKQCQTIKNMIEDIIGKEQNPEIVISMPDDYETIKNFCSVLRLPYRETCFNYETKDDILMWHKGEETKQTKISQKECDKCCEQIKEIKDTYGQPLDRLINILLLAHRLDCNSCDAIGLLKGKLINDFRNVLEAFVRSINEYRFALSCYYNTGEVTFTTGWGIPKEAERVARRWSPNFVYYGDYFTALAIKKRFNDSLGYINLEIMFEVLKKLPNDFLSQWNNQASKISEIVGDDYWITFGTNTNTSKKQNLSDVLPKYKDSLLPVLIKWAGKFQSIFMPVLKKFLGSWQYNNLENKLNGGLEAPTTYLDSISLLDEFLKTWHSILEEAEKKQRSKLFYLK